MEVQGLKTMGDVGTLDNEGFPFIVDRKAAWVVSGGVNIYPVAGELVPQDMPGVAECTVFGIPADEFGETLGAAVQTTPGEALTADTVRRWLRGRIARNKVPRVVSQHAAQPREDTGQICSLQAQAARALLRRTRPAHLTAPLR